MSGNKIKYDIFRMLFLHPDNKWGKNGKICLFKLHSIANFIETFHSVLDVIISQINGNDIC